MYHGARPRHKEQHFTATDTLRDINNTVVVTAGRRPEPKRAWTSAVTIGGSYAVGGIIPLAPYMVAHEPNIALMFSVALTSIALLVFGYIKGRFTGVRPFRTAIQTLVVGACAASVAFAFAKLLAPHQ